MAHAAFDTLKFVETLTSAGISEPQAKAFSRAQTTALAEAIDGGLATKTDIHEVRLEIQTLRTEFKTELRTEIHQVESKLSNQISLLSNKIAHLAGRHAMLYWMLSLLLAGVGAMLVHMFGPIIKAYL